MGNVQFIYINFRDICWMCKDFCQGVCQFKEVIQEWELVVSSDVL